MQGRRKYGGGRAPGSVTEILDSYLEEEMAPRIAADPRLLHDRFAAAKYYPFDAASPAPWCGKEVAGLEREADEFLRNIVAVVEEDCLAWAGRITPAGTGVLGERDPPRVAVLNLANEFNCGGAFSIHRGSQEEYIFRNSTLPLSLWKHRRVDQDGFRAWHQGTRMLGGPLEDARERWYPFTRYGGIFTPRVEVFALSDRRLPSEDRFEVAILTIAAQDCRPNRQNDTFTDEVTLQKIRTALHMAIDNGTDHLVLGALGCGAFLNPPRRVAELFRIALRELWGSTVHAGSPYPFKRVDFAIIKSRSNISAFADVFGPPVPSSGKGSSGKGSSGKGSSGKGSSGKGYK